METLRQFKEFVDEIMQQNARTYKTRVLEKYSDNDAIKYYLSFVYNPYITTGISDKKLTKIITQPATKNFTTVKELLDYLKDHNTGKDEYIANINNFIDKHIGNYPIVIVGINEADELASLLYSIITKNLQLGVDAKTINSVMPKLIPTFNVQLANKYFEKPDYVEGKEFALTTKIDGGRIIALKENGEVSFYTRAGQQYEGLVDLEQEMKTSLPDNICLDGELTLLDKGDLTSKDQYKQTMKISRKDGIKHGLKMLVFDCMSAEQFKDQKCNTVYTDRRKQLEDIFADNAFTYFVKLPILYQGTDTSKILDWLNYNIEHGEEGVMINICNAPYSFNRTSDLLKVKKFNSCDLRVVGLEAGTNKNSNRLGAFICEYKDGTVSVGSGISEEQREEIWNNKDKYIGTIIEVQYFEETTNQQGGLSLRFPVFKDFRPDKTEPSY